MISTKALLRTAAATTLLQYAAHGTLFTLAVMRSPNAAAEQLGAVQAGAGKTFWSLYLGYGVVAVLFGVLQIVALLMCASLNDRRQSARFGVALLLIVSGHAAIVWFFFGLFAPIIFDIAVACLIGAAVMSRKV